MPQSSLVIRGFTDKALLTIPIGLAAYNVVVFGLFLASISDRVTSGVPHVIRNDEHTVVATLGYTLLRVFVYPGIFVEDVFGSTGSLFGSMALNNLFVGMALWCTVLLFRRPRSAA